MVALGETLEEAFHYIFNVQMACEVQVGPGCCLSFIAVCLPFSLVCVYFQSPIDQ